MVMTATELAAAWAPHERAARLELARLSTLDKKIRGGLVRLWTPDDSDLEYKDLQRKSKSPWLDYTATATAQGCRVDGYVGTKGATQEAKVAWERGWQDNGMDGRQNGVTLEAIRLGYSYIVGLPAVDKAFAEVLDAEGEPVIDDNGDPVMEEVEVVDPDRVVLRPASSLQSYAVFDDPFDEYPRYFITRVGKRGQGDFWESSRWMFLDDEAIYYFDGRPSSPNNLQTIEHGRSYTPVALIPNTLPTFGPPESSVEAAIPIYHRIVDATFTLEMVQRYGAFPQRWGSGVVLADGSARVSVDSIITSTDPASRFGNFLQASLSDVVTALDAHIKHLAAVTQVPPHYLLGAVVNMSAEGIAAAESGYFRNIGQRQDALGEGYELAMRIAADYLGLEAAANDTSARIHWEDVSSRSLAQIADAVTKLATLKAPLDQLFRMVPGWTQTDAEAAAKAADKANQQAADQAQALATSAADQQAQSAIEATQQPGVPGGGSQS